MNTNILKKCLEELSKEGPKLDYIRGMLETLIEMQESHNNIVVDNYRDNITPFAPIEPIPAQTKDDATILDTKAAALVAKLKAESERMNQ